MHSDLKFVLLSFFEALRYALVFEVKNNTKKNSLAALPFQYFFTKSFSFQTKKLTNKETS